jgi:glycosyltransferase involved in cell wall biosynthesis
MTRNDFSEVNMIKITNAKWADAKPCVTIVTPAYNRALTMPRTIASVEAQTFRDFEYIIVDDGSKDDLDSVVKPFMASTNIPVMYIKKENGGVHTARNAGVKEARGLYYIELDSDDELTPNALQYFVDTWNSIPKENRALYREVVCQCKNEHGIRCGEPFPDNINELSKEEAHKACAATKGEHFACSLTSIRKENPFLEPKGVTFYTEAILWAQLDKKYKSFYSNEIVRIYHSEGDDHLNTVLDKTPKKKTVQACRNGLWECCFVLNNWGIYKGWEGDGYLKNLLRYSMFHCILSRKKDEMVSLCKLQGIKNNFMYGIFYLPVWLLSWKYEKARM